jgi:outer membrane protein
MALGNFSPSLSFFTQLSTGYFSQDRSVVGFDPVTQEIIYSGVTPVGDQFSNNFRKIAGFQLSIPIFGKGQRFTNLANAKRQTQLRTLQLESAKNTLRQDIEQAYNNARIAAESYYANKKSFESAQKSQEMLDKRYRSGMSNEFELQQAKNTLAAAESEMAKAKYTYVFRLKVLDFYKGKRITLN